MSSGEILAQIKKLEKEKAELEKTKKSVSKLDDAFYCTSNKFNNAASLIEKAGSIGGMPFDSWKTKEVSVLVNDISNRISLTLQDINLQIALLEEEIANLYIAYQAALAREEAARMAAEQAGASKNTSSTIKSSGGCFLKGMKVLTNDGYKNIDKIKIKDKVLSYNVQTNKTEYKEVTKTFIHKKMNDILYTFIFNNKKVCASSQHRFYIRKDSAYEWIKAEDIRVGYKFVDSNMNIFSVEKILTKKTKKDLYNIEVEDNHNYYISKNNILVHNRKVMQ